MSRNKKRLLGVTAGSHAPTRKKIDAAAGGEMSDMVGEKVDQGAFGFLTPETTAHHFRNEAFFAHRFFIGT